MNYGDESQVNSYGVMISLTRMNALMFIEWLRDEGLNFPQVLDLPVCV